jgi:TPP-dependent indolepyruvate ferredoxin oxidoreductase alpha subunit
MNRRFLLIGVLLVVSVCACEQTSQESSERSQRPVPSQTQFRCEGKTRCSQMSSCEEATFYLRNCPGTEMDGDGDGIPCESQWCGH